MSDATRKLPLDDSKSWVVVNDLCALLKWSEVFPKEQLIEIDLGAGDGGFVAARAKAHPEINFLAVERLLGRARKIARKAARHELPNLKVLRLESFYTLRYLIPPGSVSIIHLMFPDPWPKRKHHRRRVIQPEFIAAVVAALQPQGEFRFTTDHEDYFTVACPVIESDKNLEATPLWNFTEDPQTDFQIDFENEGRKIHRKRWKKSYLM